MLNTLTVEGTGYMDLRVKKTLKEIRMAFLDLVQERSIEKITVKKLCETAMINKTTFYAHYNNINVLIKEIEDEFVTNLTCNMEYVDLFFSDPEQFILKFFYAFWYLPNGKVLLTSSRRWILLNTISESLRKSIYKEYPNIQPSSNVDMALTYIIFGLSSIITMHDKESIELCAKQAGRATSAILKEFI